MKNPRKLAFDSLERCEKDGKYSNLEVASRISSNELDPRDKSLYTALVYGVIEKRISLDALISKFSKNGRDSNLWNGESTLTVKENFTVFNFQSLLAN